MHMRRLFYLALAAASIGAGGCAVAPEVAKQRVLYPPPPEIPRVEFLGAYQDQHSFPKADSQIMKEKILGKQPSQGLARPVDVASDGKGRVFVSDTAAATVYVYDLVNYKIRTLGEGVFVKPVGLAVDADGTVYVADGFKNKVLVFDSNEKPLFSIAGFGRPVGIAVDDRLGRIYVSDVKKHNIQVFDKKGGALFTIGERGFGEGEFNFPLDVEVAPDGSVVVLDAMNARIQIFDQSGKFISKFGRRGSSPDSFGRVKGLGVDTEGHIYISDAGSKNIKIYDMEGTFLMVLGASLHLSGGVKLVPAGFSLPSGVDVDDKNGIFVADQLNKLFQHFQYLDEEYLKKNPLPGREGPEGAGEGGRP